MKTYEECIEDVAKIEGKEIVDFDDLVFIHHKVKELLDIHTKAAELYADQFKIKLSPDRVLTQNEFNKVYQHYQEILMQEDVAGFYADQFSMANRERNELKEKFSEAVINEFVKIRGIEDRFRMDYIITSKNR